MVHLIAYSLNTKQVINLEYLFLLNCESNVINEWPIKYLNGISFDRHKYVTSKDSSGTLHTSINWVSKTGFPIMWKFKGTVFRIILMLKVTCSVHIK